MAKTPMNTMRRKVIADGAPQKKTNALQEEQTSTLDTINETLQDIQAGVELGSETTEQVSDTVKQTSVTTNELIENTNAGIELSIDESVKTNENLFQISEKLTQLANLLQGKVQEAEVQSPSTNVPSTEVIQDSVPELIQPPPLDDLLQDLIPPHENNRPDEDFFPPPQEEPKEEKDQKKKEDTNSKTLETLLKTVKGGFKQSISLTDKISSMLFSYTVSAVANMAKTAAMILLLIFALDTIKIHFDYWTGLFEENFNKFSELAGKWGPVLADISNMANNITDAFSDGAWTGLTVAIIEGLVSVIDSLGELLMLGMSKLLAGIVGIFDKDKAAYIEGQALTRYQERTGAEMTEEEHDKMAKFRNQERKDFEKKNTFNKKGSLQIQLSTGQIDQAEYDKQLDFVNRGISDPLFEGKTDKEAEQIYKDQNKFKAEIKRTTEYIDTSNKNNSTRMASAAKAVEKIDAKYQELGRINPELLKDLEAPYKKMQDSMASKVSAEPESSENKPEAKQVELVEKLQTQQNKPQAAPSSAPVQVNTAVNNNHTTVHRINPVTSTPAPGMGGMTKPN